MIGLQVNTKVMERNTRDYGCGRRENTPVSECEVRKTVELLGKSREFLDDDDDGVCNDK